MKTLLYSNKKALVGTPKVLRVVVRDFVFCPLCGKRLNKAKDKKGRMYCSSCGFVQYKNPIPSVGAVPIKDGKILLIKRGVEPQKGMWTFPTGFIEEGESPREACLRELKEETGFEGEVIGIIEAYQEKAEVYGSILVIMYLVRITAGELIPGDDAEDARFFLPEELPDLRFNCFKDAAQKAIQFIRRDL